MTNQEAIETIKANYPDERYTMLREALDMAMDVLKTQEPRVIDAQELKEYLMINESGLLPHEKWKELEQRAPVYIEFRTPDELQVNWRTVDRLRPWAMESMFWDNYNKDRRCWTSRPTDEQREAVKWE